jgi:hypothetical protein
MSKAVNVLLEKILEFLRLLWESTLAFWTLDKLPSAAVVLQCAFAVFLMYAARSHLTLDSSATEMTTTILWAVAITSIVCGILIIVDPKVTDRTADFGRLLALVWVGTLVGCALILLDHPLQWIDPLQTRTIVKAADPNETEKANAVVALAASAGAFIVLLVNTLVRPISRAEFLSFRGIVWAPGILILVCFNTALLLSSTKGLNLLLTRQ